MGILISILGNSGVGKTTLARALAARGSLHMGLEQHHERPFQQLFKQHPERFGLANQIDYLLLRVEQEHSLRAQMKPSVLDGGLEQDLYVYSRLFYQRGYLSAAEFNLCERLYQTSRRVLPPPDLMILLRAPLGTIQSRFMQRGRDLEITRLEDLATAQAICEELPRLLPALRWLVIDSTAEDEGYTASVTAVMEMIGGTLP